MREAARREGRPPRYDGRWRDRDPSEAPPGVKPVIRLRAPQEGETVVEDAVQGRVVFPNKDLDDLVLLRSDGTPTYMLAVVVDDHDMGVTQIIRGDDHLTNAARQTQIYDAFGWPVPAMAHIPLIHGPDGSKLSKRHGALGVDAYRALGYLPAAVRNYLVRLGWSQGDREFFSTRGDDRGLRSCAGASLARALRLRQAREHERPLHARDARRRADARRSKRRCPICPAVRRSRPSSTPTKRAQVLAAMPGLKERAKTLVELVDGMAFLFAERPLASRRKGARDPGAGRRGAARRLLPRLAA